MEDGRWKMEDNGRSGFHHGSGFADCGRDIGGSQQIRHDDDTTCAGFSNLDEVIASDAADAENRDPASKLGLDARDIFDADSGSTKFCGSGKQGTETNVIEAI